MLKNGVESIIITLITVIFSSLAIIVNAERQWVAITLFVFCIGITYFIVRKSTKKSNIELKHPSSHPVFYTIEHFLVNEIYDIPIKNSKKKNLIILYLEIKTKKIKDIVIECVQNNDICHIPKKLLYVNTATKIELKNKIPDIFLDKMVEWDKRYNSWAFDTIGHIIDSEYYSNNQIKTIAILDCTQVMIRSTIVAVENTINEINGDLDKYFGEDNV